MGKTRRDEPYRAYDKEGKHARHQTTRKERRLAKDLIKKENYDLAGSRQVKPTQGWLTW